ncbi:uncharacterized [Tachysurus ichikawai]
MKDCGLTGPASPDLEKPPRIKTAFSFPSFSSLSSDQTVGNEIGHDIHPIGGSHDDEPDFGTSCNETVDTTFAQTEARP